MAVLSSGESAVSYSNGFYVDTTPPAFNPDVFMYIDVDQGDFTPVEFQGCNHTIKSLWLCEDDESEIQVFVFSMLYFFFSFQPNRIYTITTM